MWAARTTLSGGGSAAGAGVDSSYAAGGAGLRSWVGGEASVVWVTRDGTVYRVGEVAGVGRHNASVVGRFTSCKAHNHLTALQCLRWELTADIVPTGAHRH